MKCLVIDDNQIARTTLKHLAGQITGLEVVGECADGIEAFNKLQEERIDLLLLDVEMPGMSGIELIRNLGSLRPVIIFTTSKTEYAVEAFDLRVADYLVKPITPARFLQAIGKARELVTAEPLVTTSPDFVFIRDGSVVRRIVLQDILYGEAMGDYVRIHTRERPYMVHCTLKSLEERLPAADFLRIHRSYIVAIRQIDTMQDGAILIGGQSLPVADSYRSSVNRRLNIF